ncbi:hypothetical protein QAD02_021534 [Eretmocerus hayati]|uniref:Uncharacterized protein n=1 Tax=Eretmocerus hayati TaxID=131215 RepID=A0ACC2PRZ9_9HYME|nr:hypothetical protein QAD02_021534 [Eretmocerus hayati]
MAGLGQLNKYSNYCITRKIKDLDNSRYVIQGVRSITTRYGKAIVFKLYDSKVKEEFELFAPKGLSFMIHQDLNANLQRFNNPNREISLSVYKDRNQYRIRFHELTLVESDSEEKESDVQPPVDASKAEEREVEDPPPPYTPPGRPRKRRRTGVEGNVSTRRRRRGRN